MIKKLGIFIFAAVNLIGMGAGASLIFFSINQPLKPEKPVDSFKDMSAEDYLKHFNIFADKPILYKMDAFTVNLANQDEDKVVQVEVNFEMLDERSYEEVMSKSASVRDTIVKILAAKASTDIGSIQGKLYLKDDISSAINKQLSYGFIKGVYFTRFFIQ
jgi:flagellar basal body-associated protein FliL